MSAETDDLVPDMVSGLLTEALNPEPGSLFVEDVTPLFDWAVRHRLYRGFNHDRKAAAVAHGEDGPLLLSGDDLGPLSKLLVRERGGLPGGLDARRLAEALRRLTRPDPMGFVGEEVVLHQPVLPPEGTSDVDLRRLQESRELGARPASLLHLGGADHRLVFSYWTVAGALEEWIVDVGARAFGRVKRREVEPAGSFVYPFV